MCGRQQIVKRPSENGQRHNKGLKPPPGRNACLSANQQVDDGGFAGAKSAPVGPRGPKDPRTGRRRTGAHGEKLVTSGPYCFQPPPPIRIVNPRVKHSALAMIIISFRRIDSDSFLDPVAIDALLGISPAYSDCSKAADVVSSHFLVSASERQDGAASSHPSHSSSGEREGRPEASRTSYYVTNEFK